MKNVWTVLLLCVAAATPAIAEQADRSPTRAEVQAAWPATARANGQGGRAAMSCQVGVDGLLSGCRVLRETPARLGFGAALLSLAPRYQLGRPPAASAAPASTIIVETWSTADKDPNWRRRPTAADLLSVWPRGALERGFGGRATIDCLVAPQGGLYDCLVLDEAPAGGHFGDAALMLAPQFLMSPPLRQGQPVLGSVTIPITFEAPNPRTRDHPVMDMGGTIVPPTVAWGAAPTLADVAAAYPEKARSDKVGGQVTLSCTFSHAGTLTGCSTAKEEPRGLGFARAAQQVAKRFQADPSVLAKVRGASITLPIAFDPRMLDGRDVFGKPSLVKAPDDDDLRGAMARVKPQDGGRAVMHCRIEQGGGLGDCSLVSEEPAGKGVGATVLALQPAFRLTTWTNEGLPLVGSTINLPFRIQVEAPAPTPPAAASTPSRSGPPGGA